LSSFALASLSSSQIGAGYASLSEYTRKVLRLHVVIGMTRNGYHTWTLGMHVLTVIAASAI
jgi:hypothetical protein